MSSQEFEVKLAGYEDLARIKQVAIENAGVRRFSARSISLEEIQDVRAQDLEGMESLLKKENIRIYKAVDASGALAGFIIVILAFEHCITGEFQGEINDLVVLPEFRRKGVGRLLLARGEKFVRSKGLNYIALEILSENTPALSFLKSNGFVEEVKMMMSPRYPPRENDYPEFPVRDAKTWDFPKIRALAGESIVHSKPETRDINPDMLRELYYLRMRDPVEARQARRVFYLVVETQERDFIGFLLAEREKDLFSNDPQLKLINIAIKKEYWGKHAAHALFNRYLKIAQEEQIPYLTGVIASANRRSWLFFSRFWKGKEERYLLAKKLQ